jgi:DNA-binding GntR family transcriptional regulator
MRRIVEYRGYGDEERVASWIGEHLQIIDILERRRFKNAAELMASHLTSGKRHAMRSNAARANEDASEALVG